MAMTPEEWASASRTTTSAGRPSTTRASDGTPRRPRPRRQAAVPRPAAPVAQAAQRGQGGEAAFREAFGNNLDGFQKRFVDYARKLEATDEATLIENQEVLADLLVELKEGDDVRHGVGPEAGGGEGGTACTTRAATSHWQTEPNISIYFADAAASRSGTTSCSSSSGPTRRCRTWWPVFEGSPAPHAVLHAGRGHQARGAGGACRSRARIAGRD